MPRAETLNLGMAALSRRLLKYRTVDQNACQQNVLWEDTMSDVAGPRAKKYDTFGEFYPFYLSEHSDPTAAGCTLPVPRSRCCVSWLSS